MIYNFKLVKINIEYCNYLRKFDEKVPYNSNNKESRPFVGILFKIKDLEYFAPLSSPKEKHKKMKNTVDFLRLDNGNLGAINFNNMIPVLKDNYELLDLDNLPATVEEIKYQVLLLEQLQWMNVNYANIMFKAHKLYDLYTRDKLFFNIKKRCCNFPLLEEKCLSYNSIAV